MPSKKRFVFHYRGRSFRTPKEIKAIIEKDIAKIPPGASRSSSALIQEIVRLLQGSDYSNCLCLFRDKQHFRRARRPFILLTERSKKSKEPKKKGLSFDRTPRLTIPTSRTAPPAATLEAAYPVDRARPELIHGQAQQAADIQRQMHRDASLSSWEMPQSVGGPGAQAGASQAEFRTYITNSSWIAPTYNELILTVE